MKREYKTPEANRIASARQFYEMGLAWRWIRKHRPDIEQVIRAEGFKKYPGKQPRSMALPKSLDTLE
jgi:hypothetical protein